MKAIFFILILLFTSSSLGKSDNSEEVESLPNLPRKMMIRELVSLSAVLDYCDSGPNQSHEPGKGKHC